MIFCCVWHVACVQPSVAQLVERLTVVLDVVYQCARKSIGRWFDSGHSDFCGIFHFVCLPKWTGVLSTHWLSTKIADTANSASLRFDRLQLSYKHGHMHNLDFDLILVISGIPIDGYNIFCVSLSCRRNVIAAHVHVMTKSLKTQSNSCDAKAYPASLDTAAHSAGKLLCIFSPSIDVIPCRCKDDLPANHTVSHTTMTEQCPVLSMWCIRSSIERVHM